MNKRELQAVMTRQGYTYKMLATAMGVSENTFWRKMNGLNDFTLSEIRKIMLLLGLKKEEVEVIFLQES